MLKSNHNILHMPVDRHIYKYLLFKYQTSVPTISLKQKNDYTGIAKIIMLIMMRRKKFRLTSYDRQALNEYEHNRMKITFVLAGDLLRYSPTYRLHSADACFFNSYIDGQFRNELMTRLESIVSCSDAEMQSVMREFLQSCDITDDDINYSSLLRYIMRRKKNEGNLQKIMDAKKNDQHVTNRVMQRT